MRACADLAAVDLQPDSGGQQRPLERGTVAHLEVDRVGGSRIQWDFDRGDDLAGSQGRLDIWILFGGAMQRFEGNVTGAVRPVQIKLRTQRRQSHGKIGRMRRNAVFRSAQDGKIAVLATDRGAAGAWAALVARGIAGVAEIAAACALQQVAAHCSQVAHLRTGAFKQGHGHRRRDLGQRRVGGSLLHRRAGIDAGAGGVDEKTAREHARQIDQAVRGAYVLLHELHHIGAAGDELGVRAQGSAQRGRAIEHEGHHGVTPAGAVREAAGSVI